MRAVQVRAGLPDLGVERAREREWQRLDQAHLEAAPTRRGGDFAADESGADHRYACALLERRAHRQAIVQRAQHMDALNALAAGQLARRSARRDDQPVVRQLRPAGQAQGALFEVERARRAA